MQVILTGEPLSAERAADVGLVNILTEPGGALQAALGLAAAIAAGAPLAVQAARALVTEATSAPDDEAWRRSHAAHTAMMATEDVREGVRAFLEKRPPEWRGR
jgi:enoyl-CoA hydratase/carnithine racemase